MAYDPTEWHDLFVAAAGASAALAGLLFVAVSINLEQILEYEGLPERALETLMYLVGVLVVSIVGLVPGQSETALGIELLGVGLLLIAIVFRLPAPVEQVSGVEPLRWRLGRVGVRVVGTVPFAIGGVSILADGGGGLYWVAAGIVLAICGAVVNAWVLLVEILR